MAALTPLFDAKTLEQCYEIAAERTGTTVAEIKAEAERAANDEIYWLRIQQTQANNAARLRGFIGQYVIRGRYLVYCIDPRHAYDELPEQQLTPMRSPAEIYSELDKIQDWYEDQRNAGREISKENNDRAVAKYTALTAELDEIGAEYHYIPRYERCCAPAIDIEADEEYRGQGARGRKR